MLSFIDRIKDGSPASSQIILAAQKAILDEKLNAGERFPSVRQLSQELKISRTTAHKAVKMLKDAGFLVSRTGVGMVVNLPKLPPHLERLKILQPRFADLIYEAARWQLKIDDVVAAFRREAFSLYETEKRNASERALRLETLMSDHDKSL